MHNRFTILVVIAAAILPGCRAMPKATPVAPAPTATITPSPASSTAPIPPTPSPVPAWQSIGLSVQRRPILVSESGSGPLRILLIAGIHGDETEGRSALESLKDQPNSLATIRIIRDLNPDGTAAHRRTNAHSRDLNRNWPAANFTANSSRGPKPLSEPETAALNQDLLAFNPDIVLVLHSIADGPFVNFDGPAEHLADAFASAAKSSDNRWRVRPEMGYRTPGSLGSYLGIDRHIPILTIEFKRGQDEASATAALRAGLNALMTSK